MTMMISTRLPLLYASLVAIALSSCEAFAPSSSSSSVTPLRSLRCQLSLSASVSSNNHNADTTAANSRRLFLSNAIATSTAALTLLESPLSVLAAEDDTSPQSTPSAKPKLKPLKDYLYNILRVREATQQETRLISTGKFKDVQRANVKLAVKFMINNYKLSDSVIAASSYLKSNARVQASSVGQSAVQSLYTIVEYFDSSDVENIKVCFINMLSDNRCGDILLCAQKIMFSLPFSSFLVHVIIIHSLHIIYRLGTH